ncbi:MAG: folC [Candidatus Brocadiaceae bacterium]|nr:folC [Candidatus Brocadiaceae bacterium]
MTKDKTGFPSYHETLQFLYTAIDYEKLISYQYNASTFSLDRMVKMLDYVGNPHKGFPTIHVTGTKGKGSTSIMMAAVLEQAGLRTGLFTSPHLIDIRERIQINHEMISEGDFVAAATALWPYIQRLRETDMAASPTFFETLTAMAMLYFKQKRVDMAVLEVGLGGRLDSTNVVIPRVSVITNIGFDHTAILGNTLASIAYEKAGIIKQGVPVVSAVDEAEALSVIEKTCREKDARLYLLGRDIWVEDARGVDGDAIFPRNHCQPGQTGLQGNQEKGNTVVGKTTNAGVPHAPLPSPSSRGLLCKINTWRHTYGNLFLPLVGTHQAKNCALVMGVLDLLKEQGLVSISDEIVRTAMSLVQCPARVELVGQNPFIILDYAHTVASMRSLKNALLENFTFSKLILILGFSQDKDLDNILKEIVPAGHAIIVTRSQNPRAAPPEDLSHRIERLCNKQPQIADNARDAVALARKTASPDDLICITGSAYVAGEALQALRDEKVAQASSRQ